MPKKNNSDGGKKQYRLFKFRAKIVSPIALRSKAFLLNRARPFTPVVVWVQTHPRVFVLCGFFIPTWWFRLIFFTISEDDFAVSFAPGILGSLVALVFSLKKLNGNLYKVLVGDTTGSSEPRARIISGEDPDDELSSGIGDSRRPPALGNSDDTHSGLTTFLLNRVRPFTPVVVWVQTHPRVFFLCAFFIPTWWFRLLSFSILEDDVKVTVFPWILGSLVALVFSLKKLNGNLYKVLIGDTTGSSEPRARIISGEDPDDELSSGIGDSCRPPALGNSGDTHSGLTTFLLNRVRPFTPVVVWVQTHPRAFFLCAFFIPMLWLRFIFVRVNSEFQLEVTIVPWVPLFLITLALSLKSLNSTLYKKLIGDIVDPSQPQAMTAFGDDPGIQVVDGIDQALQDIALDVAKKLAALGFQLECLDYSEMVKI